MDVFSIREIKELAAKPKEQVVLIFGSRGNKIKVLCGKSCGQSWAIIPPINRIIKFIKQEQICFEEALVVHNHPTLPWHGEIIPSEEDIIVTEFFKWQLALLGINLLDHIIISGSKKQSLLEIDLYNKGSLNLNGFEIKRFLYCFLVQAAYVAPHNWTLSLVIEALEKNLDRIRGYYERPYFIRIFNKKPVDNQFKTELLKFKTTDKLINKLIDFLILLEDDKSIRIEPGKIIPYGIELQRKIITSAEYKIEKKIED
ncbi:DNA repair protein RadC [Desulfohalotomaculum tongense]|uniref:JAB domain-containing protein n=1 Tax=Desulforadius tongensis TaxID=1216062 RepID=UPI00195AB505|nr:DNA repair protein RadC [Desulforadius tongensis]